MTTINEKPNVLWFMSEDCPPTGLSYGDPLADTPTINRIAAEGVLFENAFCVTPVCAPARFALISGIYPQSNAPAEQMQAMAHLPEGVQTYPQALRDAGYYCTNNSKTHYNSDVSAKDIWDESSGAAHWRNRPSGAPFFAVFNPMYTHESALFSETLSTVAAEQVQVPSYLPDSPEIRGDIARYYTAIKRMDDEFAQRISELEQDGVLENTIIVYSSDHGGVGPRSKRFCYDEGLHVPLIIAIPERHAHLSPWRPGSRIAEAISHIDLPPTLLALCGARVPHSMNGQPMLGIDAAPLRGIAFSGRNRMDERYDLIRTVRDARYRYIRNYAPHRIYGQHYAFAWMAAGYQAWERLHLSGSLTETEDRFWQPKPAEELYDTFVDPDEVDNLVASSEHRAILERLRTQLDDEMLKITDNGFIPEGSVLESEHAWRDPERYPLRRIMKVAARAIAVDSGHVDTLVETATDENFIVRHWSLQGLLMRAHTDVDCLPDSARDVLYTALSDQSPHNQVVAAEALALTGEVEPAMAVLVEAVANSTSTPVRILALSALTALGAIAEPALSCVRQAADEDQEYVRGAARYLLLILEGRYSPDTTIFDYSRMQARLVPTGE